MEVYVDIEYSSNIMKFICIYTLS